MTKLEAFLKKVYETNEFYQNIVKEYNITDPTDITQYPILTRQQLQENRYNMFSKGYKSKYFVQQLRRQTSSGSSGVPVNVYWDYKNWYASNLSLWRKRRQWYGIHPSDKYVVFTLNAFNLKADGETVYCVNDPKNILSVNISLLQNKEQYKKLAEIINEFNPIWLYVQPFVLNRLIETYKFYGLTKPAELRYIESVGELLSSDLKRRAVEFFKVPLANMYGSEEMNGIAYECPEHHMHILGNNVLIEIKNDTGIHESGEGEAIITNLNNTAMPLIRYNQGDIIALNKTIISCPYDCHLIIQQIIGRSLDCIILDDGTEVNSYAFLEIISELNNQFRDIVIEYQFVYRKLQKMINCLVRLKPEGTAWFPNIKKAII